MLIIEHNLPTIANDFLKYNKAVLGRSEKTIYEYSLDLSLFFQFISKKNNVALPSKLSIDDINKITFSDMLDFVSYLTDERSCKEAAVKRKISTVKSFFKYGKLKTSILNNDPTEQLGTKKVPKRLPKYLTLDQANALLENIISDFPEREHCIMMIFMNCGVRLSELVGLNLIDIRQDNTMRVIGKGNKERIIILNDGVLASLKKYTEERSKVQKVNKNEKALFISKKTGKRLGGRRIEQILEKNFNNAGFIGYGFSPHKLRHTAATLMYQNGGADIMAIKEILGHESVSTTQIYTHVGNKQMADAVNSNPLSKK